MCIERARVVFKERVNAVAVIKADSKVLYIPMHAGLPGTTSPHLPIPSVGISILGNRQLVTFKCPQNLFLSFSLYSADVSKVSPACWPHVACVWMHMHM